MNKVISRNLVILLICAASLVAVCFALTGISYYKRTRSALDCQYMAAEWKGSGETRYDMISAFLDTDASVSQNHINTFRMTLESKFDEASISEPETGRMYIDCWSAKGSIGISSSRANVPNIEIYAVGGDFFYFHQLPLESGWYFNDDEIGREAILLDETAAWQLFGGSDVAGMIVTINDIPFTVSGVVLTQEGSGYEEAYGSGPHAYMNYKAYSTLNSMDINSGEPIICYEIILPSPVTNFAFDIVKNNFGYSSPQAAYVDNTARYKPLTLYKRLATFFGRSVRTDRVVYPYWENTASVTADICAALLLLTTIIGAAAGIIILVCIIIISARLRHKFRKIKDKAVERIEELSYLNRLPGTKSSFDDFNPKDRRR
jgi:hypothetical protein